MDSGEHRATGSLTTLAEEECRARLAATALGNIAFVATTGQQLLPINYVWFEQAIYFRTHRTGVLAELAPGHDDVAFSISHFDVYRDGWNVTVQGVAGEVTDPETVAVIMAHPRLHPWAGDDRSLVIGVMPRRIEGRRARIQ